MEPPNCKNIFEIPSKNPNNANLIKVESVPYSHLIFNPKKSLKMVVQHCKTVYDSVYFVRSLLPSIKDKLCEKVASKRILLKQVTPQKKNLKTLFIDLDETLICANSNQPSELLHKIDVGDKEVSFSIRPYAVEFLKNMAEIFELVLFSSADQDYARAFYEYFNTQADNALSQFLSRNECIHIYKSLYFKDLRIIGNRNLKNMVLLDNSVYSIGTLLTNGIPILSFTGNPDDLELMHMQPYLKRLSEAADVREFNIKELNLPGILTVKVIKN